MDDTIRKEAALKELKRKIAEVESEIRTQVDIEKELRDNIRKERKKPKSLSKKWSMMRLWLKIRLLRSAVNVIRLLGFSGLWRRLKNERR